MKSKTINDRQEVRSEMDRLAKKYGWQPREFADYVMRMGLNRCMAIERYGKMKKAAAKSKPGSKPKPKPKPKPKAAKVAKPKKSSEPKPVTTSTHETVPQ